MAYVKVPKDLAKVKSKVLFNLTKRQLICYGTGGGIGILFYTLAKGSIGTTDAASVMILIVLPFFFLAVYEKNGKPLEVILRQIIRTKFLTPGIRPYRTRNLYRQLQTEIEEKEATRLVYEERRKTGKHGEYQNKGEKRQGL